MMNNCTFSWSSEATATCKQPSVPDTNGVPHPSSVNEGDDLILETTNDRNSTANAIATSNIEPTSEQPNHPTLQGAGGALGPALSVSSGLAPCESTATDDEDAVLPVYSPSSSGETLTATRGSVCETLTATHASTKRIHLDHLSVTLAAGSLTCVCGDVGTGKSSFLQAILGEMHRTTGTVAFTTILPQPPDADHVGITHAHASRHPLQDVRPAIAYVPQSPWLINGTVRENILFDEPWPWDRRRYACVRVCVCVCVRACVCV